MTELELLFVILAVIYAWECACWLRRGSVAFRTWLGRTWRPIHPNAALGNPYGGFFFAAPLPPLGNVLTGNQFPLSLAPDGVLAYVAPNINPGPRPPQSGRFFRFDQLQAIDVRGKKLRLNGVVVLKCSSTTFALFLQQQLARLQKLPAAERPKAIEKLFRESFDIKAIETTWRDFYKRLAPVHWATNALFVDLFVAVPLIIHHFGVRQTWPMLLAVLLTLTSFAAFFVYRIHKAYYPAAGDDRFTHVATVLLSPATAVRAQDILSRPLLERFHPLALARVFGSRENFVQFAERVLIETHFPALPVAPADAGAESVEAFSRGALRKAVEAFLLQNEINPETLLRPPARTDDTCQAYCPRCRIQFTTLEGDCVDCGGVPLKPLGAGSPSPAKAARRERGRDSQN